MKLSIAMEEYQYLKEIELKPITEQLFYLATKFKNKIVFSTSFGQEDQVITDIIFRNKIPVKIFTLDTGRLFEETYQVFQQTIEKYGQAIEVYYPDKELIENLLNKKGPYSFYQSIENRKECCSIRKVVPLKRALKDMSCWISGLRADQSETRKDLALFDWDENYGIYKFNPLKDWTLENVVEYLKINQVPYNTLHDKGFISIGCAPCTRAIKPGENIRQGRWWWEDNSKKECGLHENNSSKTTDLSKFIKKL